MKTQKKKAYRLDEKKKHIEDILRKNHIHAHNKILILLTIRSSVLRNSKHVTRDKILMSTKNNARIFGDYLVRRRTLASHCQIIRRPIVSDLTHS